MSRLFVAAYPPADIVERLLALPRPQEPGVRWTRPEQWHVTLRFLPDAEPDVVRERLAGLDAPAAEAGLGRIGRLGRDALVVPVAGLDRLATSVHRTLGMGDDRPFLGHLTLARLRGRPACGLTDRVVDGRWWVTELALVESVLDPTGARHTVLARFPLGAVP